MSAPDRRASTFGGPLAVLVGGLAGLALGATAGELWPTLLGVVGGVVAAFGVRGVQSAANARRAAGSVGAVGGALAFALAALAGAGPVALLGGGAVAAAALNAAVSLDERVVGPTVAAVRRSATVLGVGALAAAGFHLGAFGATAAAVPDLVAALTWTDDLVRLVTLQVEALLVAELVHWAVPILDRWLPTDRDLRAAVTERFDVRLEDLPRAYWAAFGLQVILALTSWGPRWFGAFLGLLSVLGEAIVLLLRSGLLHGLLAGPLLVLIAVLSGRALQKVLVVWFGTDPPRTLADAAGGAVVLSVASVLGHSPVAGAFAAMAGPPVPGLTAAFGFAAVLAGAAAAVLLGVVAARNLLGDVVRPWVADRAATGFALAAAALFGAALLAALGDGAALAVFAGVAGALAVHDLGTTAVELGAQVGPTAEPRTGEATHAVGSLLVGAAGVGLAGLTAFATGSTAVSVPTWRARLAVALLLVAVLCFAVLAERV